MINILSQSTQRCLVVKLSGKVTVKASFNRL